MPDPCSPDPAVTPATYTTSSTAATLHMIYAPPHDFREMHHHGEDGNHYCPTGFAMCSGWHNGTLTDCDEVRHFDGNCRLWGEEDETDDFDMTEEEWDRAFERAIPVKIVTSRREYLIRLWLHRAAQRIRKWWSRA